LGPGKNDMAKSVAICHENGEKSLLIRMQNYGMVAIKESDIAGIFVMLRK
jgi:hypothetical protein